MCLDLRNSQYKSIEEVERLLSNGFKDYTEKEIINMKNSRKTINESLKLVKQMEEIIMMGI